MLHMTPVRIAHRGSWKQVLHVLSPRIREDEKFRMTIESNGQEFTFEGHLTNTEIAVTKEEGPPIEGYLKSYLPGFVRTQVSLEIEVTGPVQRTVIPPKSGK